MTAQTPASDGSGGEALNRAARAALNTFHDPLQPLYGFDTTTEAYRELWRDVARAVLVAAQPPAARSDGAALDGPGFFAVQNAIEDALRERSSTPDDDITDIIFVAAEAAVAVQASVLAGLVEEMTALVEKHWDENRITYAYGARDALALVEAAQARLAGPGEVER